MVSSVGSIRVGHLSGHSVWRVSLTLAGMLIGLASSSPDAVAGTRGQAAESVAGRLTHVRQRPGTYEQTLLVDGLERRVRIHLPPAYTGSVPLPVVILLHGEGGDPRQVEGMSRFVTEADRRDLILVTPWGTGEPRGWNTGSCCTTADDVGFLRELVACLLDELVVDEKRIVLVGFSSGGTLALQVAGELSSRLAVVAAVSPNAPTLPAQWPAASDPASRVALLLISGEKDGEASLPVEDTGRSHAATASWWATANGCTMQPEQQWTPDGSARVQAFPGCRDGIDVVLLSIPEGGHSWPGGRPAGRGADQPPETPSATALIIDFLDRHPRL